MQRYLIVSSDSHLGPTMERDLRPYCPHKYLETFDDHRAERSVPIWPRRDRAVSDSMPLRSPSPTLTAWPRSKLFMIRTLFSRDLDEQGIAATLLFAGGGNDEVLPWSLGAGAGDSRIDPELRMLGEHIWNAWLVDFVAAAPDRLIGVMQQPIFDLDRAIEEIYWGKEHGLGAITSLHRAGLSELQ